MRTATAVLLAGGAFVLSVNATLAAPAPEIRLSASSRVPACVTPDRLMAFLRERNTGLDPRFRDIAGWYKKHGEAWRVRWDYAFYQMIIETNYLLFYRSPSIPGDVKPSQNNFAGIGTTGGGVPGDSYPDVSTGVLAQIQHLVVYSGERLVAPVAPRTRLKQDEILSRSLALNRPVSWSDLAGRWAADRNYWRSIEFVADRFRGQYCSQREAKAEQPSRTPYLSAPSAHQSASGQAPAVAAAPPASAPPASVAQRAQQQQQPQQVTRQHSGSQGSSSLVARDRASLGGPVAVAAEPADAKIGPCRLLAASYGGRKTVLIAAPADGAMNYHIVTVLDGFERSMTEGFLKARAQGGVSLGEFASRDDALARARELCPSPS